MKAERRHASSGSPFESQIGFSRAVRIGNMISVAGTAPIGEDGKTAGVGDVEEQTRRCFELIERALVHLDASLKDVIRTRVMLTKIEEWKGAAKVHGEIFGAIRPASTFVEVKGLINPEWIVEIEADAVCGAD